MNIKLYEFGLDESLKAIEQELRGALGSKLSKQDKDARISKVLGAVETLRLMVIVSDEESTDAGNE